MIRYVQLTLGVLLLLSGLSTNNSAQTPGPVSDVGVSNPGFDGLPVDPALPVSLKFISPAPSDLLLSNTVDVFFELDNYILAAGGNRIRVILDNNDPVELDNIHRPVTFRNLVDGGHTVRALVVRPDGVSLANKEAFAMEYFFVKSRDYQNFVNPELPFLTVTSPMSGPVQPDPLGRVWIDFRANNVLLGLGGTHTIRYTCNKVQGLIDKPLYFPGMKPGHYQLTVELLTSDQQSVPGPVNKVTRVFDVLPVVTAPAQADPNLPPVAKPTTMTPPARRPDVGVKVDVPD